MTDRRKHLETCYPKRGTFRTFGGAAYYKDTRTAESPRRKGERRDSASITSSRHSMEENMRKGNDQRQKS